MSDKSFVVIPLKNLYVGETAEITEMDTGNKGARMLMKMGVRPGCVFDLIHKDCIFTNKLLILINNSRIAFDLDISDYIKVRPIRSYYEIIKEQANYDSLTQTLTRKSMDNILINEYKRFKENKIPFTILIADIDRFKRINDNYGHHTGDSILKYVSNLIQLSTRRCDFISRWGGEEFLIILKGAISDNALMIAERIRNSVHSCVFPPFQRNGNVTISIGLESVSPEKDIGSIINNADLALNIAKNNGRNRVEIACD